MEQVQQQIPMAPAGFIPIPEAGPPTPDMSEQTGPNNPNMSTSSGPSSLNAATTTLPANLPTYAAMAPPLGLLPVPLGMPPGLRLPPPGAAHLLLGQAGGNANAMATHLLSQSILAGLGAAAAQGLGPAMGPHAASAAAAAGPSGFFNVFNPHLPGHHPPQQHLNISNNDADMDMELEDADDEVNQHKEMDGRRSGWNEPDDRSDMLHRLHHRTPESNKSNNMPGLLERLRSLANHEAGPVDHHHNGSEGPDPRAMGSVHLRTDLAGPGPVGLNDPGMYGVPPNLASSLRGAPLTAAAAEMGMRLHRPGPGDGFGTPGRGGINDDPFMPRHLG